MANSAWMYVKLGAHSKALKYGISLPSARGEWIPFQENRVSEKTRRQEQPWQFREVIVGDKSKVSNIGLECEG